MRRKTRMRPNLRGFEGEDDTLVGYACFHQLVRDACFGAVVLYPDFPIADIQVQDTAVDAVRAVPPGVDQLIMILGLVENHFDLHVAARRAELGVFVNQVPNHLAVAAHVVHWQITSCCGSNATRGTAGSVKTGRAIASWSGAGKHADGHSQIEFSAGLKPC